MKRIATFSLALLLLTGIALYGAPTAETAKTVEITEYSLWRPSHPSVPANP